MIEQRERQLATLRPVGADDEDLVSAGRPPREREQAAGVRGGVGRQARGRRVGDAYNDRERSDQRERQRELAEPEQGRAVSTVATAPARGNDHQPILAIEAGHVNARPFETPLHRRALVVHT